MIVYGTRTNCTTGEKKTVDLFVELRYSKSLDTWWLHIVRGGVTGYESIELSKIVECKEGWHACAGTKGQWDTLFISERWLNIICEEYKDEIEEINRATYERASMLK